MYFFFKKFLGIKIFIFCIDIFFKKIYSVYTFQIQNKGKKMKTKIINELQEGESIILFSDNYKSLMRTIGSYISRKQIPETIRYKKA